MASFKQFRNYLMRQLGIYGQYKSMSSQYLKNTGWFRSVNENRAVDASGKPIPWITYPALEFLARRTHDQMTVFEYGSGASTLWWARRVKQIISCEHDESWYQNVVAGLPRNAKLFFVNFEYGGDYCRKIAEFNGAFDIVVVDGRDRVNCARNALAALKNDGVLVWDNTDRNEYLPGLQYLMKQGFRKLEFVGMHPIVGGQSETSILYRELNCLGI